MVEIIDVHSGTLPRYSYWTAIIKTKLSRVPLAISIHLFLTYPKTSVPLDPAQTMSHAGCALTVQWSTGSPLPSTKDFYIILLIFSQKLILTNQGRMLPMIGPANQIAVDGVVRNHATVPRHSHVVEISFSVHEFLLVTRHHLVSALRALLPSARICKFLLLLD